MQVQYGVIDSDPGVDDALAIMWALSSGLTILGITTVYGNSTINDTTRNALTILELLGKTISVYKGAATPLVGKSTVASSHGENGLGGYKQILKTKASSMNALNFLVQTLESKKKKSVSIICMGPSTNVALLATLRPELIQRVKQIIILGGAIHEPGNMSPYAEFNVLNDPEALKKIVALSCKKILIPIDVCRKVVFTLDDFNQIQNRKLRQSLFKIVEIYITYYKKNATYGGFSGGVMYDLLTIAYLLEPTLFKITPVSIDVSVQGKEYGRTKVIQGEPNCIVAIDVNSEKVKSLFFRDLNNYT